MYLILIFTLNTNKSIFFHSYLLWPVHSGAGIPSHWLNGRFQSIFINLEHQAAHYPSLQHAGQHNTREREGIKNRYEKRRKLVRTRRPSLLLVGHPFLRPVSTSLKSPPFRPRRKDITANLLVNVSWSPVHLWLELEGAAFSAADARAQQTRPLKVRR